MAARAGPQDIDATRAAYEHPVVAAVSTRGVGLTPELADDAADDGVYANEVEREFFESQFGDDARAVCTSQADMQRCVMSVLTAAVVQFKQSLDDMEASEGFRAAVAADAEQQGSGRATASYAATWGARTLWGDAVADREMKLGA